MKRTLLRYSAAGSVVLLVSVFAILTFWVSAQTTTSAGNTTVTGRLLDAIAASEGMEIPIVGATVSIQGMETSANTDSFGNFILENTPSGDQVILIDSSTADSAPDGSRYADFRGYIFINHGEVNNVERPYYLTRIDADSITTVKPSKETVVENAGLGVTLTIPRKSAVTEDGKLYKGEISISLIPGDFPPFLGPKELKFPIMVTVQPAGITFTEPALITFPNIDNLPPGSQVEIMGPDINTGKFIVIGTGQVSNDGEVIETISGGVVRTANCTGPMPPGPGGGPPMQDPPPCDDCCPLPIGSSTTLAGGNLSEEHSLVSYKSLNQNRSLTFEYNSTFADPRPIIQNQVDLFLQNTETLPSTTSMTLTVDGVEQGTMYTNVVGLSGDRKFVQALQFDASSMPTGVYPYEVEVRNNYSSTTRSSFEIGEVLVNNLVNSIYGSGWSLRDLSRLYVQEDGSILVDEGEGNLLHFKARTSNLSPPIAVGEDVGSALKFDGFNDYVTFPSGAGNMMKVLPLTVEAWVRPEVRVEDPAIPSASKYGVNHSTVVNNVTVTSGLGTVIERGHGIGVNIFGRDSTITITRLPGSGYAQRKYITNPQLIPDTWYHVAVVYTTGNHKTYLNGELIDDSSYTQGSLAGGSSLFRIGRIQHSYLSPFSLGIHKGDIDEVRI